MRPALTPAALLLSGLLGAGCGSEAGPSTAGSPVVVDERAGTVDGVGLGDSLSEIRRARAGSPRQSEAARSFPEDVHFTGGSIRFPADYSTRDLPLRTLRYRDRSFVGTKRAGAFIVFVWSPRARTRRGLQIGDDLELVTKRYRGSSCDEEVIDDGPDRVDVCTARVGRSTIAFSGDPIEGFTLATATRR